MSRKLLNIGTAIFSALKDIEGLRTYPLVADNDAKFPFAVYKRTALSTGYTKDGLMATITYIEVSVVDDKYSHGIDIAESILQAIRGVKLEGQSLEVFLDDASEDYIDNSFVQKLRFKIAITWV